MLSYAYFGTHNLAQAQRFYDAALGAIGMRRCVTGDPDWDRVATGWGIYEDGGARELAFWVGLPFDGRPASVGNGSMVAFSAPSWDAVDAFHHAAITSGGTSDGAPALRADYGADFYAAYVRDPDGNKVAAVCRGFTART